MIDFHTHILPGMDDGSRDVRESLQMLTLESEQGGQEILLTPHFYAHFDKISPFLERREHSFQKLTKALNEHDMGIPLSLRKGAEVYYFPGIGDAKQIRELTFEGTDILLLEMPFAQWTDEIYVDVKKLIEKQKLTILLAHVERYDAFQKSRKIWNQIFKLPLYAQINTGGIDKHKKKRFVKKFLKLQVPLVLGSDCHNMKTRLPNLKQGRDSLRDIFGETLLAAIDKTEERLLK